MESPDRRASFAFIDVLRAVAACLVLVFHVIEVGPLPDFPDTDPLRVFRAGWMGVDLFLVISGFVITTSALREQDRGREGARRSFFSRRLARIAPLYLLTSIVWVFLVDTHVLTSPPLGALRNVLTHALFIHNLFVSTHGMLNGPSWSLGLEMQFYVAIMLAMPWLARARPFWTLLGLVAVAMAWRLGVAFLHVPGDDYAMLKFIYSTELPGTLDAFGMGIVLALARRSGPAWCKALLAPSTKAFALFGTLGALVFAHASTALWNHVGDYWDSATMIVLWRSELALAFGLLVAAAIAFPWPETKLIAPLRYLGDLSYGVYLWHMMVLRTLVDGAHMTGAPLLLFTALGSVLLASATWHMLEKPMVEAARRKA